MDLSAAISRHQTASFEYGQLDCFLFVCDVLRDITGKDPAEPWRGKYRSEFGARRLLAAHGGFINGLSQAFGPIKPFWSMRPGDPVLIDRATVDPDSIGEAVGIFDGSEIVCLTETGLTTVPVLAARGCWNV